MVIDLLLITLIIVFIIDLSGVINSIKYLISFWLTKGKITKTDYRLKPLDCSLCMSFWVNLIYIICLNQVRLLNILVICILAFFTPIFKDILYLMKDIFISLINKIQNLL